MEKIKNTLGWKSPQPIGVIEIYIKLKKILQNFPKTGYLFVIALTIVQLVLQ